MRIALFVPCYVDQMKPEVGLATLDLLEDLGIPVEVLPAPPCCGQPFLGAGEPARAARLFEQVVAEAHGLDRLVVPSASCAATLRHHLPRAVPGEAARRVAAISLELCEFLVEDAGIRRIEGRFAGPVGLHRGCHGLRDLGLGHPSERAGSGPPDPASRLLAGLEGIELVALGRPDECCGFGGLFAVEEAAVSCRMGRDRLADHRRAGALTLTSSDVSCLLHLESLARRAPPAPRLLHVAELLREARSP